MAFREQLGMRLRGAYLGMHRRFQARFAKLGVTADQFVVLTLLAEDDGIIQKELTRRTCSDANTIAALVALLERNGWVRREPSSEDRRARRVFLTPEGRRLQRRLDRSAADLHRRLFEALSKEQTAVVLAALERIQAAMTTPHGSKRRQTAAPAK